MTTSGAAPDGFEGEANVMVVDAHKESDHAAVVKGRRD